jgi:hypothetical protein
MTMKSCLLVLLVVAAGAVGAVAQGQSRPGEMTQAHVWVENRSSSEAIPVVVQTPATPLHVQIDQANAVAVSAVKQSWEYRSIALAVGPDPARGLAAAGLEGWEAVGVLQSGPAGVTVLLKRPR